MKRFISLRLTLCLFLLGMVCNVSWAQPTVSPAPADGQWAAGTTWYQIKTGHGNYLRSDVLQDGSKLALTSTNSAVEKASLWCITGNATDGFTFYNFAKGPQAPLGMTGSEANAYAELVTDATGYTTTFDFTESKKTGGYWCVKEHGSKNNYWNKRSNRLAYWNSTDAVNGWGNSGKGDDGSALMFIEFADMGVFSTEAAPKWYSVEFKTGGHFLTDKGNGNILVTAAAADSEEEYWMFIGDDFGFKMKSRKGNYVYYDTTASRFKTTNDANNATTLKFVAGTTEGTWELQREGSNNCMNQNGGTGVGAELGEWTKGDGNNPFYLREFADMGVFSTEATPKWYSLEFKTGGHFLTDKGNGNNLVTAAAADSDEEYWMFIGDAFGFKMKSRFGNYVYYDTSASRFKTTNDVNNATALTFVAGTTDGTWELQRVGSSKCMNQNGGTGVGVQLGEWNKGDGNNPFYLNEVEVFDHFIAPVFSNANNEHWFMIQFANGNAHLASNGANDQAVTANLRNVPSQWWKFVGTAENFQLVSKDGRYATIKSGTATNGQTGNLLHMVSNPDANGFSIVASTNTNYPNTYEIIWNGASGKSFNQWGGAGAGKSIGVWDTGDNNNPLYIYMPSPDLLSTFDIEGISSYTPTSPLTLWYKNAASNMEVSDQWMEYSLPIGNGQFGASIFGGVAREEVQFNEKTLWSGTKDDNSSEYGDYENFGSLYIDDISEVFGEGKAVKNYYRQLDLSNATASVHYTSTDGTINFTREYIASNPDKVVAMRLTADAEEKISIKVTLKAGRPGLRATTSYADGKATFGGKLETITYNALAKVVPTGGTMTTDANGITVKGADEVLIILGGATDFDAKSPNYISGTNGLADLVSDRVDAAATKGWSSLYADHVADHKNYFDRCNFVLDGAVNNMPTDELIRQYANRTTGTEDYALMLEQLYFAYGRYLEMGSSRGVDLPANLQGIWNNSSEPAWNGDIHANINVQMNYWPAEPTNLSEMHMPFLNYIINMANSAEWKALAQKKGSNRPEAWTMLTENNIFGGFGSFAQNAVINNAWYVSHLWQHYRYTLDQAFLEKAFPAMWGASMFWVDRLVLNTTDDTYECPNEYSPEHGPGAENATAHSQQLVWELFDNTLKAVAILGESKVNADDLATLRDRFSKLDKGLATEVYDGQWGTDRIASGTNILREWKTSNYTAGTNGHRHMSHLMCLYPFNQITEGTDLFNAAINSMLLRGDASTGWSMGWKINLWARALDGDHSHDILELALRHHSVSGGGVYYNLYDSHSPFQIDGNFGACAGIAEMLMQSHTEVIDILPALPSVWQKGSITGLKAVGNFTVSLNWEKGKAQQVTIVSHKGAPLKVRCNRGAIALADAKITVDGTEVAIEVENGIATIPCAQGQTVVIDFTQEITPATFTDNWTASPVAPWSATALSAGDIPEGVAVNGLAVHKAETAVTATRGGDVTIKFVYSGGSHKLNILGVDLVDAEGTVVASDYHHGTTGGSHSNNNYTLTGVAAGDYTLRYFVGQGNGDALNQTNGNITVTGLALTGVAPSKLPQAGKYYRIGYDFGGDAGVKYMQSTASGVSEKANALLMTADKGEGSIFLVEEVGGNLRLKSVATGKYLKETNNNRGLADEGANVTFTEGTDGKIKIAATSYLHPNVSGTTYFVDRCGNDGCAQHNLIVEEVKVRSLEVEGPAYVGASATWNGETKALPATWVIFDGITISDPTLSISCPESYSFTNLTEGGSALGQTVNIESLTANRTITANFNIAFFSASTAEKDLVPVRIRNVRNGEYTLRLNASDNYTGKTVNSGKTAYGENEIWYLVGTEESFKIYNRVAGTGLHMVLAGTGGGSAASMNTTADNADFCLVVKDNGYAITPKANKEQSLNMHGGAGADIKLYGAGDGGSIWVVEKMDVNNPITLNVEVDKVWESSPRVAELTFSVDGVAGQTRILGSVEGQALYLPLGATYKVSSMTYRGYTYNGCTDNEGVLTASYIANDERTLYYSPSASGKPYRIPAIATAPNGHIFAIADHRPCGNDIGYGEVDIMCRISEDNGATWSDEFCIADGQGGDTNEMTTGYGDAAVVADRESNKLLVMMVCGKTVCHDGRWDKSKIGDTDATAVNRAARIYLTYNETTGEWEKSEIVEMTDHIYSLFLDGETPTVTSMFIGSGKICQSRVVKKGDYYRLYCSMWTRDGGNRVIYSDDFGGTWNVLGTIADRPASGGDEPKVEELPDGTVVLSSRKYNGRYFNLFKFADDSYTTGTWGTVVSSNDVTDGLSFGGNSTNGEIYKVKAIHKESGRICDLMLQSIPTGSGRDNVGVYYKELDAAEYTPTTIAQNWTKGKHVSDKSSCYSTMIMQEDGRVAFLFEEAPGSYSIVYIPYTLEELTADKYSLYTVNSSIGQYEIGTFYASEAMKIPAGVKAYVAEETPVMDGTDDEGKAVGTITMRELENLIPAKTGVVILGEANNYKFMPSISYGTEVENNMLVGWEGDNVNAAPHAVALPTDGTTNYVLTVMNNAAGFYKKAAGFNVYNNKAYLNVASKAGAIRLRFNNNDGTTDIIEVPTEVLNANGEIYDLSGRRVEKAAKGVYIVNGKKVIF